MQNLTTSFPWIAPGWRAGDQILPSGNTVYNDNPSSDRPVAYAALEDVAESNWDKDSSAVVQKEEEEDTELVEDEEGKEREFKLRFCW